VFGRSFLYRLRNRDCLRTVSNSRDHRAAETYDAIRGNAVFVRTRRVIQRVSGRTPVDAQLCSSPSRRARSSVTRHLGQRRLTKVVPSVRKSVARREFQKCRASGEPCCEANRPAYDDWRYPGSGVAELRHLQLMCIVA